MASTDLADVNVWIALSAPQHPSHRRAVRYWQEDAAPRVAFANITLLGLARVCSTAPLFDDRPLRPVQAWAIADGWLAMSQVAYLHEPDACRRTLGDMVGAGLVTGRTWTDAYLAAFALSASLRLVSFDADFARFPGLDLLHLAP